MGLGTLLGRPYAPGMGAAKLVRPLSLEGYLALEREASVKRRPCGGPSRGGYRAALSLALTGLDGAPPFLTPRPQPVLP